MFVVHAEDGWLTFSLCLTDNGGKQLLIVDRGELLVSTERWDYNYQGVSLQIRQSQKRALLDMELAGNRVYVKRGAFINQGAGFIIEGETLSPVINGHRGARMSGCSSTGTGGWGISTTGMQPSGSFGTFFGQ